MPAAFAKVFCFFFSKKKSFLPFSTRGANLSGPDILFRDERYVVLNKPAGLPVHSGPRGGASVEDWFAVLSRRRHGPWLAHRLDADTSGCLVVALTKTALLAAQAEFAAGRAEKIYWAVVAGAPAADNGTIDAPLRKVTGPAGWRMEVHRSGQASVSDWRLLGCHENRSLLEVRPRTGRTHQVRVHCAALGCPVIGDAVYGTAGGGLMLLARSIILRLPTPLSAEAPVPPHMVKEVVLF
jgi:tRNA pseudouridine32 synthase/23S rRNA pseudouridine746 synthase